MLLAEKIEDDLRNGIIPSLPIEIPLSDLAKYFCQLSTLATDQVNLFLLGVESLFRSRNLKSEIDGFESFFNLVSIFDRDNNAVNRFFDSVLGLRSLASVAKFDQITEEKINPALEGPMRIRGGFEYHHTQTHYSTLVDIFNYLRPISGEKIMDVGSGFGRVGHFIGLCFPKTKYLGFELIEQRVECANEVAKKNNFKNLKFHTQNLIDKDFAIPKAEYYFFYDPFDKKDLETFVDKLKKEQLFSKRTFRIIALGGYDDHIINFLRDSDWLSEEKALKDDLSKFSGAIFKSITG